MRARWLKALVAAAVLALLVPAAARSKDSGTPTFDLAGFFEGTSVSAGEVRTLFVVRDTFTATFSGRREGNRLQLDERFVFSDGPRLQRWDLTVAGQEIAGTVETELRDGKLAPPVPVTGRRSATGAVLTYEGHAPGGGERLLAFRHEMTANADGTVSNHVGIGKFGLRLAVSDVVFAKSAAALAAHLPPR
ncbi:DUF3833 family protein [Aureimonas sp. AU12]|uniref:DUF3833 family protein n=1 Tax=Aureimonas sp. AU12 TaxID=1638161 RepID=UPI000AB88C9B|nr:DUF3833 family protein [Aureimonas sp. AU12]